MTLAQRQELFELYRQRFLKNNLLLDIRKVMVPALVFLTIAGFTLYTLSQNISGDNPVLQDRIVPNPEETGNPYPPIRILGKDLNPNWY